MVITSHNMTTNVKSKSRELVGKMGDTIPRLKTEKAAKEPIGTMISSEPLSYRKLGLGGRAFRGGEHVKMKDRLLPLRLLGDTSENASKLTSAFATSVHQWRKGVGPGSGGGGGGNATKWNQSQYNRAYRTLYTTPGTSSAENVEYSRGRDPHNANPEGPSSKQINGIVHLLRATPRSPLEVSGSAGVVKVDVPRRLPSIDALGYSHLGYKYGGHPIGHILDKERGPTRAMLEHLGDGIDDEGVDAWGTDENFDSEVELDYQGGAESSQGHRPITWGSKQTHLLSEVSTDGSRSGLYQNLSNVIGQEVRSPDNNIRNRIQKALQRASQTLASLDNNLLALSQSYQYRAQLMEMCSNLEIQGNSSVRQALQDDEEHIFLLLQQILVAGDQAIAGLGEEDAQGFMDLLQMYLDSRRSGDPEFSRRARRLLVKLLEVSGVIPVSLTIHGVVLLEREAIFGGGFADIYKASYNSQEVALKRMRIFQRGQERREIHKAFCKEALLWKSFHHPHVLPFLGVDSSTFSPNLCMVSPWMPRGTILRHLSENKGVNVNNLISEIAQGLSYLHSQGVVHGDLRGNNILINDKWEACLTDFGLTVVSDATLATQTSNRNGSVRWMAPELHQPESFGFDRFVRTPASDVYAFGCVCLEVYTGKAPFAGVIHETAVMLQVLEGKRPQRPSSDTGRPMTDGVWNLIEQCWSQIPSARLDTHKVVEIVEKWN